MLCCIVDKKLLTEIKREHIVNAPAEKILVVTKRKNTV
jgi:hypothetical protein